MINLLLFPIKLVLGLVLYCTSKSFRDLVNSKARSRASSTDDTVSSGEEVIVVLKSTGEMQ